ncbi:MAG: SpoIID/LytB domain-containing protein [Acidobacteriota bacterium]
MNIVNRSGRPARRLAFGLAFALALVVSGCAQSALLAATVTFAGAVPAQKQSSSSKDRARSNQQSEDRSSTRPRTVEPQAGRAKSPSPDGPIIRIALMTDVTSVALSCSSGLVVNRAPASLDEGKKISSGTLRVELRRQSDKAAPLHSNESSYRVSLGAFSESRRARKLIDELKKKFSEPVTMAFDEKHKEYEVLIGEFKTRNEAARMLERLRAKDYEDLRIVTDSNATESRAPDSGSDTNARAAKHKAQAGYSTDRSSVKPGRGELQIVGLSADKIALSSGNELIVSAAAEQRRDKRSSEPILSSSSRERTQPGDSAIAASNVSASGPQTVRVGEREYRGEIHLILNSRGRINVVNALPLEDYLCGVVPMELSPGAYPEIEALKAQAIAARSYALARMSRHRDDGFDLVDDTRDQVYGGRSSERELTNRAIHETRGVVAVFPDEDGKLTPIEALYTANCGGRTENNEEVFGGKAVAYLRGVACASDRQSLAGRDIATKRTPELLAGTDGRSIAREVALLSVLGLSLPRRLTSNYLRGSPDQAEVKSWIENIARLARREKLSFEYGDVTRLVEFARLVAASIYGENRASTLLAPADVDYLLAGLRAEQLPRAARADMAMLLREGILRLPAGAPLDGRTSITRAQAVETLAHAIFSKSTADRKSQISNFKAQTSGFKVETSAASENGRLILASINAGTRGQGSRFTSVNASAPARVARAQQDETRENNPPGVAAKDLAPPKFTAQDGAQRNVQPNGIEVADDAWLFRNVGGESYVVDRLPLVGGERVTYHLNAAGLVDFLEAAASERGASSDRFSSVAQWQERVPVEDLQQRLTRARIKVGRVEEIEPVAFSSSSRVTEVEVKGDEGHVRLRRPQIRAALGVKEYLFVVDRETDTGGRVVAFVFTGRGWGHGVGMCQTGAYGLAKDGYTYTAILQKYYTGIKLERMY